VAIKTFLLILARFLRDSKQITGLSRCSDLTIQFTGDAYNFLDSFGVMVEQLPTPRIDIIFETHTNHLRSHDYS